MAAIRVSVITPSLNQGRFIERTIRSVLDQQVEDLEYLVMDGGSRDETLDVLRRYASRLTWISEPDLGQADAVNKGLKRARGEIIGWLNSDDIYYPGAVSAACEYLESRPDIEVVYGDANHIDADDNVIAPYPTEPWNSGRLVETCFICQPAVFFRRAVFEKYGLLNDRLHFCMDYEYWLRLRRAGAGVGYMPRVLAGSRLYPETKTLGSRVKVHREINDMTEERLGRVPDRWLFNYAHALADSRGIPRESRLRFAIAVSTKSLTAALRWNRRISPPMLKRTFVWVAGSAIEALREINSK